MGRGLGCTPNGKGDEDRALPPLICETTSQKSTTSRLLFRHMLLHAGVEYQMDNQRFLSTLKG